jgi:conjugative transfer signal peptidase TraF
MTVLAMRWRFQPGRAIVLGAVALAFGAAIWAFAASGIQVNPTPSMPMGLYQSEPVSGLRVGDAVDACAPRDAVEMAVSRGYLTPGVDCPGGGVTVLKEIAAGPGSVVIVSRQGTTINGKLWPDSAPLLHDPKGRPLHPDFGRHVLQPGEYWLMGENPLSWDSRYWGPIHRAGIRRVLRPLWVAPLPAFSHQGGNA